MKAWNLKPGIISASAKSPYYPTFSCTTPSKRFGRNLNSGAKRRFCVLAKFCLRFLGGSVHISKFRAGVRISKEPSAKVGGLGLSLCVPCTDVSLDSAVSWFCPFYRCPLPFWNFCLDDVYLAKARSTVHPCLDYTLMDYSWLDYRHFDPRMNFLSLNLYKFSGLYLKTYKLDFFVNYL